MHYRIYRKVVFRRKNKRIQKSLDNNTDNSANATHLNQEGHSLMKTLKFYTGIERTETELDGIIVD